MDGYQPTPPDRISQLLRLASVRSGDRLLDLGSGDGRILKAAEELGAEAMGVEADTALAETSEGEVVIGDFWQYDWSPFSVVFAAVSSQYRNPIVARWRALKHHRGDRLIVLADSIYAEVHIATAD